jgi:hypothetical protein
MVSHSLAQGPRKSAGVTVIIKVAMPWQDTAAVLRGSAVLDLQHFLFLERSNTAEAAEPEGLRV